MGWCSQTGSSRHPDRVTWGIGRGPDTFDGEPLPELGASFVVHRVRSPGRHRLPVPPVSVTRRIAVLAWSRPLRRRRHRAPLRTTPAPERPARRRRSGPRRQAALPLLGEPAAPPVPEPAAFLLLDYIADRSHMNTATNQAPLWLSRQPGRSALPPRSPVRAQRDRCPSGCHPRPALRQQLLKTAAPRRHGRSRPSRQHHHPPAQSGRRHVSRYARSPAGWVPSGNRRHAHTVPSHHLSGASGRPGSEGVAAA